MSEWFALSVSPLELVTRGTIMYLGLVLTFRFLLRRDVGSMSTADILFVVVVADAAQNALSGEYRSITDGIILVGTLVFWNVALDWLAFHFVTFRRFVEPPVLPLIRDGHWVRRNLRQEWITAEEVRSKLRERGIEDIAEVQVAYLESSGELGVIKVTRQPPEKPSHRTRLGAG